MGEVKYDLMSNSELKIKMTEMENEYEALKFKVNGILNRMEELDKNYDKVKNILNKRTKGRMI
jgi:chaperonin cofactor prefoldin